MVTASIARSTSSGARGLLRFRSRSSSATTCFSSSCGANRSTMKAVVQRVLSASVEVDGKVVSSIDRGLVCLVGLGKSDAAGGDGDDAADFIARKILNGRLWENEEKKKPWDKSVTDLDYEILLVSQFTLHGQFKGNRPTFHQSLPPGEAKMAYENLVSLLRSRYKPERVKDGVFGAMMRVSLVNDGPVTITLDSDTK
ncbi:D-aminoacyl-tRNA deacylase [Chloropicon roscoffensis]|uniref:D-aminoacyl-tRNA deacylase n=1 Tax=Chloropicon roscoffensis TaxID=1461544 RepID=A0AAX4PK80_9CHLO